MKNLFYYIVALGLIASISACSYSTKFTKTYYKEHESTFLSIKQRYKELYERHPFSLEIKDKQFSRIALEISTDSIRYIYNFNLDEHYLLDTLHKYDFDVKGMSELIADMQKIGCTWITNLDYYENMKPKYLVFISIRHKKLEAFLRAEKYFTLAFFDRPQPHDAKGRLLDRADRKEIRRINDVIFKSIDGKVYYALSASFR